MAIWDNIVIRIIRMPFVDWYRGRAKRLCDERTGMNQPLVYQLFRQEHSWVAKLGIDKRWKHISAKLTPRWELVDSRKMTGLIGSRCKCSNAWTPRLVIFSRRNKEIWRENYKNLRSLSITMISWINFCNLQPKFQIAVEKNCWARGLKAGEY